VAAPQISVVEPEQVERHIGERPRVSEQAIKLRSAGFVGGDDFTVEDCVAHIVRAVACG
jgi:hypothetical protein